MQVPGLPTLPTDNYHKFRAIAGLWLTVGTLAGLGFAFFHFVRLTYELKRTAAVTNFETLLNDGELRRFQEWQGDTPEEIKANADRLRVLNRAVGRASLANDVAIQEQELLKKGIGVMMIIGIVIAGWGVVLAAGGFRSWREMQAIQDEYLRRQLAAQESTVAELETSSTADAGHP